MKPHLLYISHCAPTLPDKGERIRAYHELRHLVERYQVHVACIANESSALAALPEIQSWCASFFFQRCRAARALPRVSLEFLLGKSITASYYESHRLHSYIRTLAREVNLSVTVAFSTVMAPYAPAGVPLVLDMVDVDSVKWLEYARVRRPAAFYSAEARRLQALERRYATEAQSVVVTTGQELAILRSLVPDCRGAVVENGVDSAFFDPARTPRLESLEGRRYIVMVGAMDYYPNADGAIWFATEVFPALRQRIPGLEFLVVGRTPGPAVTRLGSLPGVTVTSYVPDVRPYVAQSVLTVVPLRIARGVQNKVLEALSMGKSVLATPEIARTFGDQVPFGLQICKTVADYEHGIVAASEGSTAPAAAIRAGAIRHFSWDEKLLALDREIQMVVAAPVH